MEELVKCGLCNGEGYYKRHTYESTEDLEAEMESYVNNSTKVYDRAGRCFNIESLERDHDWLCEWVCACDDMEKEYGDHKCEYCPANYDSVMMYSREEAIRIFENSDGSNVT